MIPILYEKTETTFTSNGIGRLVDCVSCLVTEERNGVYECEFQYPITGKLYPEINEGRIIAVTHDDNGDIQPFDIYHRTAPIDGIVTFYAHHISYRQNGIVVKPFTASGVSNAIAGLKTNSVGTNPFTYSTNKTTTGDYTVTKPSSLKALLGGAENSLLDVFGGGEYKFDKFSVSLLTARGTATNVEIRYGKNLADIEHDIDYVDAYNGIVPFWFGEVTEEESDEATEVLVTLSEWAIYADGTPYDGRNTVYPLDMSDKFEEPPTEAELRALAVSTLAASNAWVAKENITVNFVQMWQTEEYKNIAPLQSVKLCDTVSVYYDALGVDITSKVIRVVYNTLLDRYDEIELGQALETYAAIINSATEAQMAQLENGLVMVQNAAQQAVSDAASAHTAAITAQGAAADALAAAETAQGAAAEALTQAGIANSAASQANEAAQAAQADARAANKFANAALDQLGVVEDVIGVLNWATEHGSFVLTQDQTIQEGKVYFTYDSQTGDYEPVVDPQASQLNSYYELSVDEAMQEFIMAHLAVTSRGLWVLPSGLPSTNKTIDNNVDKSSSSDTTAQKQANANARQADNYKVLLSNNGMYVYDESGVLVSTFGENITFSSLRPQYIGNNTAYVSFDPTGSGSLTIGGASILMGNQTLDQVLSDVNDAIDDIQVGGTNILRNTKDYTDWTVSGNITFTDNTPTKIANFPAVTSMSTYQPLVDTYKINYSRIRNQLCVLSMGVKVASNTTVSIMWQYEVYAVGGTSRLKYGNTSKRVTGTGNWDKLVFDLDVTDSIFTLGTGSPDYTNCEVRMSVWRNPSETYMSAFQLKDLKLEIGNKATDWSPAPEDVDSAISAVETTANAAAPKSAAINKTVSVYYRGTTHSTPGISTSTTIGTSDNADNAWEYVMPTPKRDCYFYTCEEYTYADNTRNFSTVRELSSETYASKWVSSSDSAYIDGGRLYAHSVTADQMAANSITIGNMDADTKIEVDTNLYNAYGSYSGYLSGSGAIGSANATRKERYSEYIPVEVGDTITFTMWVTPTTGSAEYMWMAYEFYNSSKTYIGTRPSRTQGANTGTLQYYSWVIPVTDSTAKYIRVSARCYSDGIIVVNKEKRTYITSIDNDGIYISPASQSPTSSATGNSVKIDADGMDVYKGGISVAMYGETARVGEEGGYKILLSTDGMQMTDGNGADAFSMTPSGNSISSNKQVSNKIKKGKTASFSADITNYTITFTVNEGGTSTSADKTNATLTVGSSFTLSNTTIKRTAANSFTAKYTGSQSYVYCHAKWAVTSAETAKLNFTGANTLLATNAWYMTAGQTVYLAEPVSAQLNGIVIAWSAYVSGATKDQEWQYTFIPKNHVFLHEGNGVDCGVFATVGFGHVGTKYVYVYDDRITGYASNNSSGSSSSITYDNSYWVLRYVYGV